MIRHTLLVTATELEAAPLRAAAAGRRHLPVVVVGVGDSGAMPFIAALRAHQPGRVVAFGLAGSLTSTVRVGEAVLTRHMLDPSGRVTGAGDSALRAHLLAAMRRARLPVHEGDVVTVDAPLHGLAARDAVQARTGAMAVQMEDARWAGLAAGNDMLSLRVISDDCDLPLPLPRHLLLGADGRVRWRRWLGAAGRGGWHTLPGEWRRLRRAQREWRLAMGALARAAVVLIEAIDASQ